MGRNRDIDAAWAYHEGTNHTEARLRATDHTLDFANRPMGFKIYTALEPITLEQDLPVSQAPVLRTLAASAHDQRGSGLNARVPDVSQLARVLYFSAGVLRRKTYPGGEIYFRAYANTGALYHVDLYVVCGTLPGLEAGVYHFSPHDFALRRLRAGDYRGVLVEATGREPAVAEAPVVLASASTYWRNAWKYRARTYRHCYWDAGTMHANLLGVATAADLAPRVVLGFADAPVERLLGLDPQTEGVLTLVPLGRTADAAPSAPTMEALHSGTLPLSKHPIDFPPIREMHAASALDDGAEAAAWRGGLPREPPPAAQGRLQTLLPMAEADAPGEAIEQVIARRGSTRHFDPQRAITFAELSAALDTATGGMPADFLEPLSASLLDYYLIVNNVDGLAPGSYYYRLGDGALELLREGDFRSVAGRLGLFQELPANAAVNIYSVADLAEVLRRFGNRGYRAAQLEGGIAGGRMYLAAYAQRYGATGLTFLDEDVIEFFSPHAAGKSVMFLTALGRGRRRGGA